MRKLCPNFDNVDGLETVLDVPIPEAMWTNIGNSGSNRWQNLRSLMRAQTSSPSPSPSSSSSNPTRVSASSNHEFIALLKLVGSPLIPLQVQSDRTLTRPLKDSSIVSFHSLTSMLYAIHSHIHHLHALLHLLHFNFYVN